MSLTEYQRWELETVILLLQVGGTKPAAYEILKIASIRLKRIIEELEECQPDPKINRKPLE